MSAPLPLLGAASAQARRLGDEGVVTALRRVLAEETAAVRWRWLCGRTLASLLPAHGFGRVRSRIYRAAGLRVGRGSVFFGGIDVWGPGTLFIGRNCRLNGNLQIELDGDVHIGDHVSIGSQVAFVTSDHEIGDSLDRCGALRGRPIRVGDGCWLGARVLIMPGTTIGAGCVVAAGSVVSGEVPPNRLIGGVPARVIKSFDT